MSQTDAPFQKLGNGGIHLSFQPLWGVGMHCCCYSHPPRSRGQAMLFAPGPMDGRLLRGP